MDVCRVIVTVIFGSAMLGHVNTQADDEYVTYRQGNAAIILTSPHGGYLTPDTIPDREFGCRIDEECVYNHTCGVTDSRRCRTVLTQDEYSRELTELIESELVNIGYTPFVVLNNLHRIKLDANREIGQAAFGVPEAEDAYALYTSYIEEAKANISEGILFDIHGVETHQEEWIEIGYTITKEDLNDGSFSSAHSSIRALANRMCGRTDCACFEELLFGHGSFGEMLASRQPQALVVPSVETPSPGPEGGYYIGGYTTQTHGSRKGGHVDAIQIETPLPLRNPTDSPMYARKVASAIAEFYSAYYLEPLPW